MQDTWVVFPLIQVMISIIAGIMIALYGAELAEHLGGGIIQKIIWSVTLMAFLLALYTIVGLWAYFFGSDLGHAINHTIILLMSLVAIVIGYYLKTFSDSMKALESEE